MSGCREAHIAPPCIRYSGVTRYYSHGSPAHASNPQGIWRKICARGKSGTLAGCGGRRPGACAPAARTPVQERARRTAPSSHPIGPHPLEVVHGIADAPLELLRMVRGFERAQGDAGHDLLRLDVVHIAEYSTLRKHPDERLSRTCAERRSSRKSRRSQALASRTPARYVPVERLHVGAHAIGQLLARVHVELGVNIARVGPGSVQRDGQRIGNRLRPVAARQRCQ